jgi:transcriptional regulator with XRE-family HTH domain
VGLAPDYLADLRLADADTARESVLSLVVERRKNRMPGATVGLQLDASNAAHTELLFDSEFYCNSNECAPVAGSRTLPLHSAGMGREKKSLRRRGAPPPEAMLGFPGRLERAMGDMTQEQLERASGVSQTAISNMLNGVSLEGVTASHVARVAIALDVCPGFLLLGIHDTVPRLIAEARAGSPVELDEQSDAAVAAPPAEARLTPRTRERRSRP